MIKEMAKGPHRLDRRNETIHLTLTSAQLRVLREALHVAEGELATLPKPLLPEEATRLRVIRNLMVKIAVKEVKEE